MMMGKVAAATAAVEVAAAVGYGVSGRCGGGYGRGCGSADCSGGGGLGVMVVIVAVVVVVPAGSPRGPHYTCGAVCQIAGANQRRTECRRASGTEQWHSTSAIRDAPVPRMQHGCRGVHCPSAPCLHDAECTHRLQRQVPECRRAASSHRIGSTLAASPLRVTSMLVPQGMKGMRLACSRPPAELA